MKRTIWPHSYAALLGLRLAASLGSSRRDIEWTENLVADMWDVLHPPGERWKAPEWLSRVAASIERDPARATIISLARQAGVHPAHLARAFRRSYGISLGAHLRRVRLSRCCELLASSESPLTAVALDAGFADQSHMSNVLKRETGRTPGQLRGFLRGPASASAASS